MARAKLRAASPVPTPPQPATRPIRVLAVDPGRDKCGVAVVDSQAGVLAQGVVPTRVVTEIVSDWQTQHRAEVLAMGGGTAAKQVRRLLKEIPLPVEICPEAHTTERARKRYFEEHPPRGWRRLVPLSLQTPPIPVDDYAAILIAEDFLSSLSDVETRA